ncbi:MAG: AAA family ATPase [Deltaproteobacteria bacterium]|nr:AAA family ATPase [Deltaproteobacteria bacterium]
MGRTKRKRGGGVTRSEVRRHVAARKLRRTCPPSAFDFSTTRDLKPLVGVMGQKRAMAAIEFGLGMRKRGYNIFVMGQSGSGKTSIVRRLLERRAGRQAVPDDICYIYNFDEVTRPKVLFLPPGRGPDLAHDMEQFVTELKRQVPKVLGARTLAHRRAELMAAFRMGVEKQLHRLMDSAKRQHLWVQQDEDRLLIAPLVDGEPVGPEEFESMPVDVQRVLDERVLTFQQRIANFERQRSKLEREVQAHILDEERAAIEPFVKELVAELKARYRRCGPAVLGYLADVEQFVLKNHDRFSAGNEESRQDAGEGDTSEMIADDGPDLVELQVNVLVNRAKSKGAPVIYEQNPTAMDLVGYLEYREQRGVMQTDHTLVRAGAFHRAHGGYLVLQAMDLIRRPAAWDAVKQTLEYQYAKVEDGREDGQHRLAGSVTCDPVSVDVKVILLGTMDAYQTFLGAESDFDRLFKVRADFEDTFPRTKRNVDRLARFVARVCEEEDYRPLDRGAIGRIVESCSRAAEHNGRLTGQLSSVVDLVGEADYWARRSRHTVVTAMDVDRALMGRHERNSKLDDLVRADIREGMLLIDTHGTRVGQVNGIAVYDLGNYAFGVPSRITGQAYVGNRGVVHIDREVRMTGAIHNKGTMILSGFLGGRFAISHPLSLSASITFEQSYEEVEGDSASTAELFTLLSSLAGVPIRQGVAVTGSVNQQGVVQPIGGANEKIEGIFRISEMQGLDGKQGVIIPKSNLANLMVDAEVVEAVAKGRFHIWAIETVDEGIEILTGLPAGTRRGNGPWTDGSINALVAARLDDFADKAQRLGGGPIVV